jgi:predicted Zn-dependent protease with MMP-like domain
MNAQLRRYFDEHLEQVIPKLPPRVRQLLDEVPLYVEDHPSPSVMNQLGIRRRGDLCGLYTGVPLPSRSVHHAPVLSDVIHIFREGIISMATRPDGHIDSEELRRQIRVTILHELGHHHGLDEAELRQLGY